VSERYEIVIVGAGPAGLAAGVQAAQRGVSHILLERAEFANTIHRYGKGKHVMAEPSRATLHEDLRIEFEAATREEVIEKWQEAILGAGVNMVRGPNCDVVSIKGEKGNFTLTLKDGSTISTGNIVLAIGVSGSPRTFGVPGDDLPHVQYYCEDPSAHVDEKIIVVGTGDAGIEEALNLAKYDNDVTVINLFEGFPLAKTANAQRMEAAINAGDVKEYRFTSVEGFGPGTITINTRPEPFYDFPPPPVHPDGFVTLDCDLVIGRIGALPPRKLLESFGIQFTGPSREAMPKCSDKLESSVPGIYLVGALAGKPLIKNCMNHGYEVIEHILGNPVRSADEPLLREILSTLPGTVPEIVETVRKSIGVYEHLTPGQVEELLLESKIHRHEAGEVIFYEGDFTNTFFTILEGAVEMYMPPPVEEGSDGEAPKPEQGDTITLREGEFFGEGSLISGRQRTETAVAVQPCVLIETSRLAVRRIMRSIPQFASLLDRSSTLRRLRKLFPMLADPDLLTIAENVQILTYPAGKPLFSEGDAPDGLHIIRRGSVSISRQRDGQERVLNYVQAGSYLGEVALVRPTRTRTATVKAMVLTETIRIPLEISLDVVKHYPELREIFERRWRGQVLSDERAFAEPKSTEMLDFVIAKGGKEATDLLVIDEALCIRCDNCEKACGETHGGVSRLDREAGPRYAGVHLPTACQHCENPLCMTDCPPDALRRDPDGEVYILDTCIGCGNCAGYCPYEVIKMSKMPEHKKPSILWTVLFGESKKKSGKKSEFEKAVKCDLCREVPGVRAGERAVACVASCPTGAIVRLHPMEFVDDLMERG
jgi:CRP-like cAMP-binding protein/thioredoxin reductase/Fe-S-cluster-containing dehydrogenase component